MILAPPDSPLTVPLAVAATRSGDHAGVVYLWPQTGAAFFFHHIGEDDLRHESADMTRLRWARPALATDELEDVAARASLLDDMYTAQGIGLPYGFDRDLGFDEDGRLVSVDPDAGLTCATFVSAVFESAGFPLVDRVTWDEAPDARRMEDEERQRRRLDDLAVEHPQRAQTLADRVRAPHLRVEEIIAASTLTARPGHFLDVEPLGRQVLVELEAASVSAEITRP